MKRQLTTIIQEKIEQKIFIVRSKKVMLDKDLAELYKIKTEQLKRQVRRNMDRFPEDFLLKITREEFKNLGCHFGRSSWGGTRSLPYAFTEHGILMLSSVLNSNKAIEVNIQIMRTFTKLRELMLVHKDLRIKIEEMESKYDSQFQIVFKAIKKLLSPPVPRKPKIPFGFQPPSKNDT